MNESMRRVARSDTYLTEMPERAATEPPCCSIHTMSSSVAGAPAAKFDAAVEVLRSFAAYNEVDVLER